MKKVLSRFIIVSLVLFSGVSLSAQQDVKGSKDHPLLSRMQDFHISDYKESEFDSHKFVGADKKPVSVEGHWYYIEYRLNNGLQEPGELKLRRNVQDALRKIGGKVIFDDNFNKLSTIVIQKDGKETWVEVRSWPSFYRLNIIERTIMKQEIIANADAMGDNLKNTGHVAVYGINFDFGKADLRPESDTVISQISILLKNDLSLKLYVVGHTDNAGTLDLNMKLSKERADAVVNSLTTKYGIQADRLKSFGLASLAPVASNDTDEGRAKNRRVELVKQ